jgi:hypothetical protein
LVNDQLRRRLSCQLGESDLIEHVADDGHGAHRFDARGAKGRARHGHDLMPLLDEHRYELAADGAGASGDEDLQRGAPQIGGVGRLRMVSRRPLRRCRGKVLLLSGDSLDAQRVHGDAVQARIEALRAR